MSWEQAETFILQSEAFPPGGSMPPRYTCDGENESPPLLWSGSPSTTEAFALLVNDVDVPGASFIHWLLFNIPADINRLPASVPRLEYFEVGTVQVRNSTGRIGYDGPCPPPGELHHYRFTLVALDAPLALGALASAQQVLDAIRAHTLDTAVLVGTYERPHL
ncbi:YbhB/YbcL family Raf kinase inhibitor-like protein [Nitrolancea hollandica]|uniref:PEBP family protein n=1 Tax=Nitrolancea hollandica Lb TaxID=1129897 RepID=I4EK69_9BACT|nr:YbhB/YbcL family Raf kinase inhibitor-like protein [Nitrolancea hollandica]CCF85081.1 conserved hypothetical protein [Nitrolancea hollandica Lb]